MESNQLRDRAACFTSPRRGEIGSRLRDPGEGDHARCEDPDPLTRNGRAMLAHSDLSIRTRVYPSSAQVAEVGFNRLRPGKGDSALRLVHRNTL